MKYSSFVPNQMKTSVIRVCSYQDKNIAGTLANPYFEGERSFSNLTQLLFMIEGLLDDMNTPEPAMKTRSFFPGAGAFYGPSVSRDSSPPIATFTIQIIFRQGASWQGMLTWVDEGKRESFRSVLELIHLMDSALCREG
nr:hypothetical protein [bacterium]